MPRNSGFGPRDNNFSAAGRRRLPVLKHLGSFQITKGSEAQQGSGSTPLRGGSQISPWRTKSTTPSDGLVLWRKLQNWSRIRYSLRREVHGEQG